MRCAIVAVAVALVACGKAPEWHALRQDHETRFSDEDDSRVQQPQDLSVHNSLKTCEAAMAQEIARLADGASVASRSTNVLARRLAAGDGKTMLQTYTFTCRHIPTPVYNVGR